MRRLPLALLGPLVVASSLSAATFTVTNTSDSGAGSLRQAITDANANPGADTIAFNITGAGVQTIALSSSLPVASVTGGLTVDGTTQPGYAGTPLIALACANTNVSAFNFTAAGCPRCRPTRTVAFPERFPRWAGCVRRGEPECITGRIESAVSSA